MVAPGHQGTPGHDFECRLVDPRFAVAQEQLAVRFAAQSVRRMSRVEVRPPPLKGQQCVTSVLIVARDAERKTNYGNGSKFRICWSTPDRIVTLPFACLPYW